MSITRAFRPIERYPVKFLVPHKKNRELRLRRVARWPEIVVSRLTTRSKRIRQALRPHRTPARALYGQQTNLSAELQHWCCMAADRVDRWCEPRLLKARIAQTAAKAATTPADRCSGRQGVRGQSQTEEKGNLWAAIHGDHFVFMNSKGGTGCSISGSRLLRAGPSYQMAGSLPVFQELTCRFMKPRLYKMDHFAEGLRHSPKLCPARHV